jgi:hypothetical protein
MPARVTLKSAIAPEAALSLALCCRSGSAPRRALTVMSVLPRPPRVGGSFALILNLNRTHLT